jgi:hypothetical protein
MNGPIHNFALLLCILIGMFCIIAARALLGTWAPEMATGGIISRLFFSAGCFVGGIVLMYGGFVVLAVIIGMVNRVLCWLIPGYEDRLTGKKYRKEDFYDSRENSRYN